VRRSLLPLSVSITFSYWRLDKLEMEIREREREYKAIAAALKGEE